MNPAANISRRLQDLTDRMNGLPCEPAAREDELMAVHDELLEIANELARQIGNP